MKPNHSLLLLRAAAAALVPRHRRRAASARHRLGRSTGAAVPAPID